MPRLFGSGMVDALVLLSVPLFMSFVAMPGQHGPPPLTPLPLTPSPGAHMISPGHRPTPLPPPHHPFAPLDTLRLLRLGLDVLASRRDTPESCELRYAETQRPAGGGGGRGCTWTWQLLAERRPGETTVVFSSVLAQPLVKRVAWSYPNLLCCRGRRGTNCCRRPGCGRSDFDHEPSQLPRAHAGALATLPVAATPAPGNDTVPNGAEEDSMATLRPP